MTNEEIDKIIFDTIPAPIEAGINEMRSLVLAGMRAEREACAQVAMARANEHGDAAKQYASIRATDSASVQTSIALVAEGIAAAIRKRGEK
jgi:hypothetical protein